jgi:hypothetical protein
MSDDPRKIEVTNLPLTQNGKLGVELIPMPSGDNPWRTQGDYRREQRRDSIRFWLTIATLIVSIISVAATATVAIVSVRNASGSNGSSVRCEGCAGRPGAETSLRTSGRTQTAQTSDSRPDSP